MPAAITRSSPNQARPAGFQSAWSLSRQRALLALIVLLLGMLMTACASLNSPNRVVLSANDLQALLNRQFPQEQRLLDLFEVRASAPGLRLLPESRRLAVKLDLLARERLLGNRISGRIDFNAGLRWNPADYTVRLEQVRVQDLALTELPLALPSELPPPGSERSFQNPGERIGSEGLSTLGNSLRRTAMERLGAALAERMLEDLVLYRLSGDRLARLQASNLQPSSMTITASGLEITFSPASP